MANNVDFFRTPNHGLCVFKWIENETELKASVRSRGKTDEMTIYEIKAKVDSKFYSWVEKNHIDISSIA